MSLFLGSMSCSMTVAGSKIVFCRSEVLAMCCDYALEAFAGDLQREFQLLGVSALQMMRGFLEPRQGDVSCEATVDAVQAEKVFFPMGAFGYLNRATTARSCGSRDEFDEVGQLVEMEKNAEPEQLLESAEHTDKDDRFRLDVTAQRPTDVRGWKLAVTSFQALQVNQFLRPGPPGGDAEAPAPRAANPVPAAAADDWEMLGYDDSNPELADL
ncbi:hypothetical protein AK812_SmicGene39787 [Symbiodinium microadriaticum]|uniref:Uncharacterized protein n=1 Tax=Symbiodinium microadriaticum TaxID=2951 RepID=A0A1Q9CAC2_SYMMI|nr:hypothetical protein AK812_SmicGene39787 [Symbiodinium microadriaticum]